MTKRTSIGAFAILALVVSQTYARPNLWAQNGARQVFYATTEEAGLLSLNFLHLAGGYSNQVYGHVYTAVGFAPLSFLDFSVAVYAEGYRYNNDDYRVGPIMFSPAVRTGYPFYLNANEGEEGFFVAPGLVIIPRLSTGASWHAEATPVFDPSPSLDLTGVVGFGNQLVGFTLNAGYRMAFDSSGIYSTLPYGAALEFSPLKILDVVLEITNRVPTSDIASINFLELTPMIRISTKPQGGVTFDIAAPIGVGNSLYPWKVELGVSAAFDIVAAPREPLGKIFGRVLDEEEARPLYATINFPETELEPVGTDSLTGNYSVELPAGVYRIRAESSGYKWKEQGVVLQENEEKILDFTLAQIKEPKAQLAGSVNDASSGKPLEGVAVSFKGEILPEVSTDALGIFKTVLPPGTYQVVFSKQGYASKTLSVTLDDGERKELEVALGPPVPEESPEFQNVQFNPGSAVIDVRSYPALEEVLVFLKANPEVRFEIQGHTDSIGDDATNLRISQERADAVLSWLVNAGIDSGRLVAKGYGETKPIGDNRTRRGQEQNRRIEFVVISE